MVCHVKTLDESNQATQVMGSHINTRLQQPSSFTLGVIQKYTR